MKTFAEQILAFYQSLSIGSKLPKGVEVLNPYQAEDHFQYCRQFYHQYYHDHHKRFVILGINPGRYGGGVTGVPFTDPIKLEQECGIKNDLAKKPELSADFIHKMMHAFGGVPHFYRHFYFNSVSPLGFTLKGKNLNYYDTPALIAALKPFILQSIRQQLTFTVHKSVAFCLGEGDNYRFLLKLNDEHKFFHEIVPLPHPRFVMQYKRKTLDRFIDLYVEKLQSAVRSTGTTLDNHQI